MPNNIYFKNYDDIETRFISLSQTVEQYIDMHSRVRARIPRKVII